MSSKSTPIQARFNRLLQSTTATSGNSATPKSTPNFLRKRVINSGNQPSNNKNESNEPKVTAYDSNTGLNKAFLQTVSTCKSAAPSTPRIKPKSTALNACYTPSSLYRCVKKTPLSNVRGLSGSALSTPHSTTKLYNSTPDCSKLNSISAQGTHDRMCVSINDAFSTNTEISNLSVAVRVRPFNAQECMKPAVTNIVRIDGNQVTVYAGTSADSSAGVSHSFQYDHAFYSCNSDDSTNYATQEKVFQGTGMPLIDKAFEGYNACLFAYGQTGSGKSYSMMGIEGNDDEIAGNSEAGIIPRFCHELFRRIEASKDKLKAEIEVSYFEIYNEKIHDLLCVTQVETSSGCTHKNALKVREHPIWGPYVVDLSIQPVESYDALRNWLAVGNSQRATAATGLNDKSSRSHSIFNIVLNLSEIENSVSDVTNLAENDRKPRQTRRSKISLVDLAGSERINHSGSNGDRIREGVSINKSLLTLGKVIAALADFKRNSAFVPYRESVLTWLLRENLGGNSKTLMLATISPASIHIDETLATLRYACQARTIVNRVKVNEDPHDKIIRELRAEVDRLQSLRQDYERNKRLSANNHLAPRKIIIETSVDESEVEALRQQLAETEKELNRAQKSWMERLKEAEDQRKSELRLLRRKGLALELSAEQKQACLVNLAADPILSGTLFYILPLGIVKIGRTRTSMYCSQPDIVLDGPLVGYHHCSIENTNGKLFITPENEEFETFLNGELVQSTNQMYHGDRLVIGGSHYFRISNPFCQKRDQNQVVDFQLAHQEILHKQEEKLRRELDEEKRAAFSQIEMERIENERNYKDRMEMLELEQFKFKCNKELLETEKRVLEEKSSHENVEISNTPSVYKSTLLDDINRIMQYPSEECLHKTQLMVKEATQRCRSLGLKLEFKQSQILDEFGMFRAVVIILDKKNRLKAEWPTARLDVWLDIVRENFVNAENIFNCVDIEWVPIEDNLEQTFNDSLNSSRISLNLSLVKDAILKQPFQKCSNVLTSTQAVCSGNNNNGNKNKSTLFNSPTVRNTKKMLTYEDDENTVEIGSPMKIEKSNTDDFLDAASIHIRDMQRSSLRVKKLFERFNSDENNFNQMQQIATMDCIRKSIEQLDTVLHGLRTSINECKQQQCEISPSKTPKSVRFFLD